MNTFRISALALAVVLALDTFASAQCGVQRSSQLDPLNLSLSASPCANGQCNLSQRSAASSSSIVSAPAPIVTQPQVFAYSMPAPVVQQYSTATMPLYVVQPNVAQFISQPGASASSSAGSASSSASSSTAQLVVPQLVQPIQAQQVSACNGCNRRGLFKSLQLRAPRSRSRSVSVSRS